MGVHIPICIPFLFVVKLTGMTSIISFLSGKKTYIVGALTILLGCLNNWDMQTIMIGLAMITGRAAISKVTPTA